MAKKKKASPVKSSTVEKNKPAPAAAPRRKDAKGSESAVAEPPAKAEKGRKGKNAGAARSDEKVTRLVLIKQRHEAIRREIDQIREDLESDEEE